VPEAHRRDYPLLQFKKPDMTLRAYDFTEVPSFRAAYDLIGVHEAFAGPSGKQRSDRALSRAGHAYEDDIPGSFDPSCHNPSVKCHSFSHSGSMADITFL